LHIHGYHLNPKSFGSLAFYGTDAPAIQDLIGEDATLDEVLDPALPYIAAEVIWAAREEMARTVEDILARRTRALFLDTRAAIRMAPRAAALLARELGRDTHWEAEQVEAFVKVAGGFLPRV
jgi:glycerol-3-phosphate dehydrogenase